MRNFLTKHDLTTEIDLYFDNIKVKETEHCYGCGITKQYCKTILFRKKIRRSEVLRYRPENYIISCLSCMIDGKVQIPQERSVLLDSIIRDEKPPTMSQLIDLLFQIRNNKIFNVTP